MTILRRTTTPRARPMPCLEPNGVCDECGQYRAGNHRSCSKKRQERYAQARKLT